MVFCSKCGNEEDSSKNFCSKCGTAISGPTQGTHQTPKSRWWYLVPIFMGVIGGVIAYLILKDDDQKLAKNCMILGLILTVVWIGAVLLPAVIMMSTSYLVYDSIEREAYDYETQYEYDYNDDPSPKIQKDPFADIADKVKQKANSLTESVEVKIEEPVAPVEESSGPKIISVEIPDGTSTPGCEEFNTCFDPASVTINVGDTVVWHNTDTAAHTVTGGSPNYGPSGVFDSSLMMGGTYFENTFYEAGTYDYFCMVHPWMVGLIRIQ